MSTKTRTKAGHRAQSVRWQHAPKDALLVARAYCTSCGWEVLEHCRLPGDVRVIGLGLGPRRQAEACECGGPVYVDLSRG